MDERKRRGGRNRRSNRSNRENNEISGINPTNALYIGSAVIAGAVLLYSGLKLLLNSNQSESKSEDTKELKMEDLNKSKEIPTKPTPVNPPKKTIPNNKKEELSSTTTKNFSATKTPSPKQPPQKTEEERLQEFAKLIEKQKAETKKLTKRSWNVLNEKDSESFRVPKDFDIKSFHSLEESFNSLDITVKRFIYHLYQASWIGSFINATQSSTTKELFELLILIFTHYSVEELRDLACEKANQKVSKEEYEEFVNYSALVFLNLGNYHHQDRKKFIPNLSKTSFEKIVNTFAEKYPKAKSYYTACESVIFDVTANNQKAGVKDSDAIPFYSGEISFEETILSEQDVLNSEKYTTEGLLNSCLLKTNKIEEGKDVFELYTSAVEVKDVVTVKPKDVNFVIKRKTGLFSGYLKIMSQHLFSSLSFLPGVSRQKDLLLRYINYFGEGSQSHFDVAQRLWQYEHNPQVEFHFAFVPTYKDPFKKRGEARSFVGLTTQTELAQKILSNAKKIVDQIPQSSNFAQYPFALPVLEFVDLISFVHSFVPSSISFPEVEFMTRPKTVVFTNTFDVKTSDTLYFSESQKKIFAENFTEASIIYTTLYQVFGYPFGKFFTKNKMGNYNFDVDMINPLTNEKIVGHYLPGEIFSVLFGDNAEILESLKADAIALYLSLNPTVLSIFNVTDTNKQQEISTSLLLSTAQSLLRSLSLYDENTKQWENPKHHAKYILGNYLLEKQIFSFEENSSENSFSINFDFQKVSDVAKQSLEQLLQTLFVYRAVGNVEQTKVLFEKYSVVPQSLKDLSSKFFPLRNFSSLFVQPNLFFTASGDDNKPSVTFKSYPNTKEGLINSFADRFK